MCTVSQDEATPKRFAVDCMLGKLSKWLRVLGFDTIFFQAIEDDELLRLSRRQGRILLSRDTALLEKADPASALFILSDDWRRQVRQTLEHFGLQNRVAPYSRCLECNLPLKAIPRERARNLVTPFVFETAAEFSLCPGCSRIFWRGSHHADMEDTIEQILGNRYNTPDGE